MEAVFSYTEMPLFSTRQLRLPSASTALMSLFNAMETVYLFLYIFKEKFSKILNKEENADVT